MPDKVNNIQKGGYISSFFVFNKWLIFKIVLFYLEKLRLSAIIMLLKGLFLCYKQFYKGQKGAL